MLEFFRWLMLNDTTGILLGVALLVLVYFAFIVLCLIEGSTIGEGTEE